MRKVLGKESGKEGKGRREGRGRERRCQNVFFPLCSCQDCHFLAVPFYSLLLFPPLFSDLNPALRFAAHFFGVPLTWPWHMTGGLCGTRAVMFLTASCLPGTWCCELLSFSALSAFPVKSELLPREQGFHGTPVRCLCQPEI